MRFKKQAQVRALLFDEIFTAILIKYFNYKDVFLIKNIIKLIDQIKINEYSIKLNIGKQPLFGLIYSERPVKSEILKTYIKTNLINNLSQSLKSFPKHLFF